MADPVARVPDRFLLAVPVQVSNRRRNARSARRPDPVGPVRSPPWRPTGRGPDDRRAVPPPVEG